MVGAKMKIKDFFEGYLGVAISYWKNGSVQCVDVARQFWNDVWNIPQPEGLGEDGSAEWFFTRYDMMPRLKTFCERVEYQPGMIPPEGAAVLFGPSDKNKYGHVGICVTADESRISIFEQDGIRNSQLKKDKKPQEGCVVKEWGYSRVLGWLLKRKTNAA
jgi:hypothetical protein